MKLYLTVAVCLLVVNSSFCIQKKVLTLRQEDAVVLVNAVQKCLASTGVPLDDLLKVNNGGYSDTPVFKSFIYCCHKETGQLTPDGKLDLEKGIQLFKNEPEYVEGMQRCGKQTGKNNEEALFNFFKCFQDTVPVKLGI